MADYAKTEIIALFVLTRLFAVLDSAEAIKTECSAEHRTTSTNPQKSIDCITGSVARSIISSFQISMLDYPAGLATLVGIPD